MRSSRLAPLALLLTLPAFVCAQQTHPPLTRADTLRGTVTPERAWWDVFYYDLALRVDPTTRSVAGSNTIHYTVTGTPGEMQIDLAAPLQVDSVVQGGQRLQVRREGDVFWVRPTGQQAGGRGSVTVHYGGQPRVAANPPWDGGFVWARDPAGNPWVGTAVQGIGASQWWPNKDHQSEEPDSMRIRITVPQPMVQVSNGRLEGVERHADGTATYNWVVRSPINNYGVTVNAGNYVHFGDRFQGEAGALDLDYWVLEPHLEPARRQFEQVKPMLQCFEGWFGPYPFYRDGFKMVETPYLGMEHQSAIAYGNQYQNGYLGQDLSRTGLGLTWDYIIIHEAAHEWWGNNVTTRDIADMWVHEGFAAYAEGLWVECLQGKEAGGRYIVGTRGLMANDEPVIGTYGVNREGSGDMYVKGASLLHTLRQVVNDDALWRSLLRGIQETFGGTPTSSAEVEAYVSRRAGRDFSKVFDQYLRHAGLPVLEYTLSGGTLRYRWRSDVAGFDLPVRVTVAPGRYEWIEPVTGEWKTAPVQLPSAGDFRVDENFLVRAQPVQPDT